MDRNEIWIANLRGASKTRPVLILTRSSAVKVRQLITVAVVTGRIRNIPSEVFLSTADGMKKNCVVNCDVLQTIPKDWLLFNVTTLSPQKMNEVHDAIKFALELP